MTAPKKTITAKGLGWLFQRTIFNEEWFHVEHLVGTIEKAVTRERPTLRSRYYRAMKSPNSKFLSEASRIHYQRFPHLLRHSVFLSIYSTLDRQLGSICHNFDKSTGKVFDTFHVLPKAPERLKIAVGLDITSFAEWSTIEHYGTLRNWLAHNGPELTPIAHTPQTLKGKRKDTEAAINALKHVSLDPYRFIMMTKGFCASAVETTEAMIHKVIQAIVDHFNNESV